MMDSFSDLTPPLLLIGLLNGLGVLFKTSPLVPNKYIPYILVTLGGIGYPLLAQAGDVNLQVHGSVAYNVVLGIMFALSSVGGHQLVTQPVKGDNTSNEKNNEEPNS